MTRCLIVESRFENGVENPESENRISVHRCLLSSGMTIARAAGSAEMRDLLVSSTFDIIVLDLAVPDENALDLCRWAHQASSMPVIMVTARADAASGVQALDMGADDFIGRPFSAQALVTRIQTVLRRLRKGERADPVVPDRMVTFNGWCLDRMLRQLISPAHQVTWLSNVEFRLLSAFVDRPRRVLSRNQLLELSRAPGGESGCEVEPRSIDLGVSRLRRRLGDSARAPRLIRTMRGAGYLFDVTVQA